MNDTFVAIAIGAAIGVSGSLALEFVPPAIARWHAARFGHPPGLITGPLVLVVIYALIFAVLLLVLGRAVATSALAPYLIAYLGTSLVTRTLVRRTRRARPTSSA